MLPYPTVAASFVPSAELVMAVHQAGATDCEQTMAQRVGCMCVAAVRRLGRVRVHMYSDDMCGGDGLGARSCTRERHAHWGSGEGRGERTRTVTSVQGASTSLTRRTPLRPDVAMCLDGEPATTARATTKSMNGGKLGARCPGARALQILRTALQILPW